jgi:hypothetical protein
MIPMARAIKAINPSAEFSYIDEDYDTIKWLNGTQPISLADIEAKKPGVEAQDIREKQEAEAAKQVTLNKLSALGLTPDDLKNILR